MHESIRSPSSPDAGGGAPASSCSLNTPTGSPGSSRHAELKADLGEFYQKRDDAKRTLYLGVFKLGFMLALLGAVLVSVLFFFIGNSSLQNTKEGMYTIVILTNILLFLTLLGWLAITSVPSDKLCVDTLFSSLSPVTQGLSRLIIAALMLGLGFWALCFLFPYGTCIPLFVVGVWVAWAMPPTERAALRHLWCRSSPPGLAGNTPPHFPDAWTAISPRFISTALVWVLLSVSFAFFNFSTNCAVFGPTCMEWGAFSPRLDPSLAGPLPYRLKSLSNGLIALVVMLSPLFLFFRARAANRVAERRSWRTDLLYSLGDIICVAFALSGFIWNAIEPWSIPVYFAGDMIRGALFLFAGLWRPLGGARWAFAAFARRLERRFEFSRKQMKEDGAELASLVTRADTINWDARCHWVLRKTPTAENHFPPAEDTVKRQFWLLGHFVVRRAEGTFFAPQEPGQMPAGELLLRVCFSEDADTSWTAKYIGNAAPHLEFRRLPASNAAADFFDGKFAGASGAGPSFASWRAANFPPTDQPSPTCTVEHEDPEGGFVVVRVPISNAPKTAKQIEDASKSSLRKFTPSWAEKERQFFHRDLLEVSPREVKAESKAGIYGLSEGLKGDDDGGIDFFLSHSWDEVAPAQRTQKYDALRSFLSGAPPRGGASLWFDKTCLNTEDKEANANAIAALPIFTGTCSRVVILLSPTYLRRLWCVWELQCVFTFCLRELAVERIVVVLAGGDPKDAATWSLDRAHTFDPNEEFRLRSLVHAIGVERFVDTVRNLPACSTFSGGREAAPVSQAQPGQPPAAVPLPV